MREILRRSRRRSGTPGRARLPSEAVPTPYGDVLAGDPTSLIRGKEHDGGGNVFGLSDSDERVSWAGSSLRIQT